MFRVIPIILQVKLAIFFIAVLYIMTFLSTGTPFSLSSLVSLTGYVSLEFIILVWLVGMYGWKLLWRINSWLSNLLNKKVCPDLDGYWKGHIASNWKSSDGNTTEKYINVKIEANLFFIRLKLETTDNYSSSCTVTTFLQKDQNSDEFILWYLYINESYNHRDTDERLHHGAGRLLVKFNNENEISLTGHYWTNRLWQKNMNTAGKIQLSRLS